MDLNFTQVVVALIGVLGSMGFWKYRSERAAAKEKQENEFNAMLMREVETLKAKIEILIQDKEELLLEIATLRSELSAAKTELHAMTTALRFGNIGGNNAAN